MIVRWAYRLYRRTKIWLLVHRPPILTWLFFSALTCFERVLAFLRERKADPRHRQIQSQLYFLKYSRATPPFALRAESQVADDSADCRLPRGARNDNSTNPKFNQKLYSLFNYKQDLALLDLGCSGGGLVKSVLDDGFTAVGLEGADICKRLQRAEWGTIPLHLFTCDITRPFSLETPGNSCRFLFDVITMWEVLEHIPRENLPGLIDNIHGNLKPSGLFIASVDMAPDENPNCNAVYHHTLEDRKWWTEQLARAGFDPVENHGFRIEDWVRGNGTGLFDWDPADGDGFHLVLRKTT